MLASERPWQLTDPAVPLDRLREDILVRGGMGRRKVQRRRSGGGAAGAKRRARARRRRRSAGGGSLFTGVFVLLFSAARFVSSCFTARDGASEEEDEEEQSECVVCCDRPVEAVLLECGHAVVCLKCSEGLKGKCPICRQPIARVVKLYYA